ncbi:MAG: phosphate ABC transporter ATP-binding protein PstB [Firmicutes bacterium]|nr:phosphate ABC transporter ATP-binding protein PstB [Bacillota bacterium]
MDLKLYYGKHPALRGVSASFRGNAITAIIGPSGCGKSSLLRCLNRMNDRVRGARVEGSVLIDGKDIYSEDCDVIELRRRVGMVFQRPVVFPLSVFDNVAVAPRVHGLSSRTELEQAVERALSEVMLWEDLKDRLRHPALDLSIGQQQQLCIARAIATRPDIVLLDEPCSALDPYTTLKIEDLLRSLSREYTIIIVTHNMQQAARASDETIFMLDGEVVEHGPSRALFMNPRDPRTNDYVTGRLG